MTALCSYSGGGHEIFHVLLPSAGGAGTGDGLPGDHCPCLKLVITVIRATVPMLLAPGGAWADLIITTQGGKRYQHSIAQALDTGAGVFVLLRSGFRVHRSITFLICN